MKYLNRKRFYIVALLILVVTGDILAQSAIDKKVDSLFVIASSGDIKYRDKLEPAMDAIAAMGEAAVPRIVSKMTTKSARERVTINQILKKIGSPAVPYMVQSLKSPDELVLQRICTSLGEIGDSSATGAIIAVSTNSNWQVRDQALGALGNIGSNQADNAVLFGFNDTIGQVRKAVAVASRKLKITKAIPALVHLLGDDFYGARMSAYETLLILDTTLVLSSIADSLGSTNQMVGNLGCYVLGELGGDQSLDLLWSQYGSPDPLRRAHAVTALIKADPNDNCGFRDKILQQESDRFVLLKLESAIYTAQNEQQ